MLNKKIFIIGGTGSLGNKLINRYIETNNIICYSRDECKHWKMSQIYKTDNIKFIIGDIRDYNRLEISMLRENPDIIIIAGALKHIDKCEYAIDECIQTNTLGPQNVLNVVERNNKQLTNLQTVCFISTDKACSPVNAYGMSKALAEKLMIEKSYYMKNIKFVCVRYGNVLNSRGSIIPLLHEIGNNHKINEFSLTHKDMTRFIMSLDDSVNLIEHAILYAESGDIVIPKLISMRIEDLLHIFSELYNKQIKITNIRPGEKIHEILINTTESHSIQKVTDYMYIKPNYKININSSKTNKTYSSKDNIVTKEELKNILINLDLLEKQNTYI